MIAANPLKNISLTISPKWLALVCLAILMVIIGIAAYHSTVLHVEKGYTVKAHAYGRSGHAADEATVRLHVRSASEWWYNPNRPNGNELYVGLAGTGPTALIFYNSTRNSVDTVYYESTMNLARRQARKQGYTVPVAIFPIP